MFKTSEMKLISETCSLFCFSGRMDSIVTFGNGNINDTFLLSSKDRDDTERYILQRINHEVFNDPVALMDNFSRVIDHLKQKSSHAKGVEKVLSLIETKDGKSFTLDGNGNYWRMLEFISEGCSLEFPENKNQAYEAARAFGNFQSDLNDLPEPPLVETIPDFHNPEIRYQQFITAMQKDRVGRVDQVSDLITFVKKRDHLATLIRSSEFPRRVVHNDTKFNNILLHKETGRAICVVDLDTVMPGCVLHDFGDLVRTAACSSIEDEQNLDRVNFLPEIFESIVQGYLKTAGNMLSFREIDALPSAPLVITYELGLRFLTDYLEGDHYFKVKNERHNLDRSRAQFKLLESMEKQGESMREIHQKIVERF